jgi:hypothetical protein
MVSGVRTASGFEERIRFAEMEIIDRDAIDTGVLSTMPQGNYVNGWDVNVAGVRITTVKRNIRSHKHAVRIEPLSGIQCSRGLMLSRNFSSESKERARRSTSLADATGISLAFTSSFASSCLVKFSHQCQRRISRTLQPRLYCHGEATIPRRRPYQVCQLCKSAKAMVVSESP